MDIRKLQRVIVDGLEDVKAQNIVVFNTEHLSSLFERVIIASGTSNRQTKSLATSVREAVKDAGFPVPRTEGETNGEWIIVDCGAAVVHVMQPTIRDFYHLEEIWGDKPVRIKLESSRPKLVKASEEDDSDEPAPAVPSRKRARRSTSPAEAAWADPDRKSAGVAAKKAAAKKAPARKAAPSKAGKTASAGSAPARKTPAKRAADSGVAPSARRSPVRKVPSKNIVTLVVGLKRPAKKTAASSTAARKTPTRRAPAKKAPGRA